MLAAERRTKKKPLPPLDGATPKDPAKHDPLAFLIVKSMLLTGFDAPDSNVCTVRRERSNTPLQALTLLNDQVFVEAAQALGARVLAETPDAPDAARLAFAVKLCLGRAPTGAEADRLAKLLSRFRTLAAQDGAGAAKLLGAHKPAGVPAPEAAAWVALARTLMNLDEFVTRE